MWIQQQRTVLVSLSTTVIINILKYTMQERPIGYNLLVYFFVSKHNTLRQDNLLNLTSGSIVILIYDILIINIIVED